MCNRAEQLCLTVQKKAGKGILLYQSSHGLPFMGQAVSTRRSHCAGDQCNRLALTNVLERGQAHM